MRCLLVGIALARFVADADALDLKERPVNKVIHLLQAMRQDLEKEAAADKDLFAKLDCWCTTNRGEKREATDEAQRRITALVAEIEKHSGKSAALKATLGQLQKEIAANQAALAAAQEVRSKERDTFNQDEKDMFQAIESLKNAVLVLSKHHSSFLQLPATSLVEVKGAVYHVLASKRVPAHMRKQLQAFLQQPAGAGESYAPASGQVFGVLKQMKDTFESNLSDAQKAEVQAASEFAAVKAAKNAEIAAAVTSLKAKQQGLADSDDALANAKEALQLTRDALSADQKFLMDLNLRCQQTDKDYEARTKTRSDEIAAVGETIKILSEDDARDLFSKTLNFGQKFVRSSAVSSTRQHAASVLQQAGAKSGSAMLLALSASVQLDAFTKVKKAIDDMVAGLKAEQADEVQHRDFCVEEFNRNAKDTQTKQRELSELESLIATSTATIEALSKDLAALRASNAEMAKQSKRAGEDRALENKEFQAAVQEHRATQAILKKALTRLSEFYTAGSFAQSNREAAVWLQGRAEPGAAVKPMPEGFKSYEKNAGASGVQSLLQKIIDDAHGMENDAIEAENDSQATYDDFIKNTNASTAANNKAIVAKTESKADTSSTKVAAGGDRASATEDAEKLAAMNAQLHGSCDFVTKNFDARQAARTAEMESLAQAKAILSGADLSL